MLKRWWDWFTQTLRVQYRGQQKWWWGLVAVVIGGMIGAIVGIALGSVSAGDINTAMIDANILNMTAPTASIGSFLWQRVLVIGVPVMLVFGCGLLGTWGVMVVFPVVFFQGYWLCLSLWWTWLYFGVNGLLVLVFYAGWLILVSAVMLAGVLWAMNRAQDLRACRCQKWEPWGRTLQGLVIIILASLILGLVEYLIFWTILGRIVYKAV